MQSRKGEYDICFMIKCNNLGEICTTILPLLVFFVFFFTRKKSHGKALTFPCAWQNGFVYIPAMLYLK